MLDCNNLILKQKLNLGFRPEKSNAISERDFTPPLCTEIPQLLFFQLLIFADEEFSDCMFSNYFWRYFSYSVFRIDI